MDDQSGDALPGAAHWPPGATAEDVAEARRLYELTGTPVSAIRERFRWTAWYFQKLRVRDGWTARPRIAEPGPMLGRKPVGADAIAFRLNRLIAFGVATLERRAAADGMEEAGSRALVALCRAQEIMMRADRTRKLREKKNKNDGTDFRDDPVWLAAEFARRLSNVLAPQVRGAEGELRELAGRRPEEVPR